VVIVVVLLEIVGGISVDAQIQSKRIFPQDFMDKIICGDCLEVMKEIDTYSVDLIVTDPPYGITENLWDIIPDFEEFTKKWLRVCGRILKGPFMFVFWSQ